MHYIFGGIPTKIASAEQGIVSYIQKILSHFGLEILRDAEGSKSIALVLDLLPGIISPALGCNYTSC